MIAFSFKMREDTWTENTFQKLTIRKTIITRANRKLKSTINEYLNLVLFCLFVSLSRKLNDTEWQRPEISQVVERKYSIDLENYDQRCYCQKDWIYLKRRWGQWKTTRKSQPTVVHSLLYPEFAFHRLLWMWVGLRENLLASSSEFHNAMRKTRGWWWETWSHLGCVITNKESQTLTFWKLRIIILSDKVALKIKWENVQPKHLV